MYNNQIAPRLRFSVIIFLELPHQNIPDYVCVPQSWIRVRNSPETRERIVQVAYPQNEYPMTTSARVRTEEPCDMYWNTFMAILRYETDEYHTALEWIAIQNRERARANYNVQALQYNGRPPIMCNNGPAPVPTRPISAESERECRITEVKGTTTLKAVKEKVTRRRRNTNVVATVDKSKVNQIWPNHQKVEQVNPYIKQQNTSKQSGFPYEQRKPTKPTIQNVHQQSKPSGNSTLKQLLLADNYLKPRLRPKNLSANDQRTIVKNEVENMSSSSPMEYTSNEHQRNQTGRLREEFQSRSNPIIPFETYSNLTAIDPKTFPNRDPSDIDALKNFVRYHSEPPHINNTPSSSIANHYLPGLSTERNPLNKQNQDLTINASHVMETTSNVPNQSYQVSPYPQERVSNPYQKNVTQPTYKRVLSQNATNYPKPAVQNLPHLANQTPNLFDESQHRSKYTLETLANKIIITKCSETNSQPQNAPQNIIENSTIAAPNSQPSGRFSENMDPLRESSINHDQNIKGPHAWNPFNTQKRLMPDNDINDTQNSSFSLDNLEQYPPFVGGSSENPSLFNNMRTSVTQDGQIIDVSDSSSTLSNTSSHTNERSSVIQNNTNHDQTTQHTSTGTAIQNGDQQNGNGENIGDNNAPTNSSQPTESAQAVVNNTSTLDPKDTVDQIIRTDFKHLFNDIDSRTNPDYDTVVKEVHGKLIEYANVFKKVIDNINDYCERKCHEYNQIHADINTFTYNREEVNDDEDESMLVIDDSFSSM